MTGSSVDCDERIGSYIGDGDPGSKTGARYSERGNVEIILAASRVGVEAVDPIVAEPRSEDENIVAGIAAPVTTG